jgi:hypothetical protein
MEESNPLGGGVVVLALERDGNGVREYGNSARDSPRWC